MTRRKYEITDRYGNLVDDDVIPDGGKLRVPMMMRDGQSPVQRSVMDAKAARFDDSAARHGPGPIYCDRSAALAVYEDEKRALSEAWKTPAADDAADRRRLRKGVARDPFGRETGSWEEEEEEDAASIVYRGESEGDVCTVREGGVGEGSPGHLRMVGGKLTCVPDPAPIKRVKYDAASHTIDAATARQIKREAFDAMCAEMREAWRKPQP